MLINTKSVLGYTGGEALQQQQSTETGEIIRYFRTLQSLLGTTFFVRGTSAAIVDGVLATGARSQDICRCTNYYIRNFAWKLPTIVPPTSIPSILSSITTPISLETYSLLSLLLSRRPKKHHCVEQGVMWQNKIKSGHDNDRSH